MRIESSSTFQKTIGTYFPIQNVAYSFIYLITAMLAIIIALVTVTVTSLKAARIYPAIALHNE